MRKVSYIIIPGLGDQRAIFGWSYRKLEKHWRRKGVCGITTQPRWVSDEGLEPKYRRLRTVIREELGRGREVVVVGVSAGASLGLLAFAEERGVKAFVSVCGFTRLKAGDRHNSSLMNLTWFQAAAAAEDATKGLSEARRRRIMSLVARGDRIIDVKRQPIAGALNVHVPTHGHMLSIVVALLWYRRRIVRFATSKG